MNTTRVVLACAALALSAAIVATTIRAADAKPAVEFHTSDRCVACHNGMRSASGEDVSIGFDWRASMMANSSRDPYWQVSVRRETIDHKMHGDAIQDECAICHMPMARATAHANGGRGQVFALAPGDRGPSTELRAGHCAGAGQQCFRTACPGTLRSTR